MAENRRTDHTSILRMTRRTRRACGNVSLLDEAGASLMVVSSVASVIPAVFGPATCPRGRVRPSYRDGDARVEAGALEVNQPSPVCDGDGRRRLTAFDGPRQRGSVGHSARLRLRDSGCAETGGHD